jgi:hypothetical protein
MAIFISHHISTRDTHISQRAEGLSANIGVSVDMGYDMKIDIL